MKYSMSEILSMVEKAIGTQEKIDLLIKWGNNVPFKTMIRLAHDPDVKWLLPAGNPPYKPAKLDESYGRLFMEMRRMYLFVEGSSHPHMTAEKRQSLFIEVLESIHSADAELLLSIKDKKGLPYAIPSDLFENIWPGIFAGFSLPPVTRISQETETSVEVSTDKPKAKSYYKPKQKAEPAVTNE